MLAPRTSVIAHRNAPPQSALENAPGSSAIQTWKTSTMTRNAAYPPTIVPITLREREEADPSPSLRGLGTGLRTARTTIATKIA